MRKGRDGEKNGEKTGKKREKMDGNSGHYVIASSRPPERWNAARSRQHELDTDDLEKKVDRYV